MATLFSQFHKDESDKRKAEKEEKERKKKERERKRREKKARVKPSTFANVKTKNRVLKALGQAGESLKMVEILYIDKEGKKSRRRLEPYSLKFQDAKKVYFYGHCAKRDAIRSFLLDAILEVYVLTDTYAPRFEVSLTKDVKEVKRKLGISDIF